MAEGLELRGVWARSGGYHFAYRDGRPWVGDMGPVQHLLAAVVGCAGITMQAILSRMKIDHQGITIDAVATKPMYSPCVKSISLQATVHALQRTLLSWHGCLISPRNTALWPRRSGMTPT